jgi:SRSO17 transposase
MRHWLVIRRSTSTPDDYAYDHAYAPAELALPDLVRVAGTRWVIESGFEQAKGEVGLDHYEVRRWTAWHRHVTLALLAHAYLTVMRATLPLPAADMVPVSVAELRRLREVLTYTEVERQYQFSWSRWR